MSDEIQGEYFIEAEFSPQTCFLCGIKLTEENTSNEHVFPEWLLHKYDLWNRTLILPNRTYIQYRNLIIPCCANCNNGPLSLLENEIKKAIEIGPLGVSALDKLRLYQWMGKIFFGLFFKDTSLLLDRRKPDSGTIAKSDFLEKFRAMHGFLKSIIEPTKFQDFFPGSIIVLQVENYKEIEQFDYSDDPIGMSLCIRMGNIGIIACLKDDEQVLHSLQEFVNLIIPTKLHPIQWDEVCALFFYRAASMVRQGNYLIISPIGQEKVVIKIPGFNLKPVFNKWDSLVFSNYLADFWEKWGLQLSDIFFPPDTVRTYFPDSYHD